MKKRWLSYLIAAAASVAVALLGIFFEAGEKGVNPVLLAQYVSDGFFLAAVLFLGFSALTFIAEAGSFYGIRYLGYTLMRLFSPRRERFDDRKDYFTYCTEKQAEQKEKGKSSAKWVLLHVGLGCLLLSLLSAFVFYRM